MTSDPSRRTTLPVHKLLHLQGIAVRSEAPELAELLVASTVRAAVRVGRDRLPPALVLSRRAAQLVTEVLQAMHDGQWKLLVGLLVLGGAAGA